MDEQKKYEVIKKLADSQGNEETINLTLAVLTQRTVDNGHSIRFGNHYYRMLNSRGIQEHYFKGTKVIYSTNELSL